MRQALATAGSPKPKNPRATRSTGRRAHKREVAVPVGTAADAKPQVGEDDPASEAGENRAVMGSPARVCEQEVPDQLI